ncbi:hypothetical protein TPHA_0O00460 [Tetrapisispora phaffii CBS 4417]|uniref:guanosine-diphosphatase n=1 Tax=Tetrapisispora phaffii (strain ATCC 24235 / CBS 4417 / NBRC 1672 / NRRL Y-8282 / UCD 70-5) TaxID=1071381 RepID=G8C1I9_TETPH|nr:hypothetical protein TPHA_0O00460 [Tetrapisispora phaffii CBS 4417]CCE66017.1 hypothetical protein TPHA_0O00460 [Tetrapisispora phaffii CBS 4417]
MHFLLLHHHSFHRPPSPHTITHRRTMRVLGIRLPRVMYGLVALVVVLLFFNIIKVFGPSSAGLQTMGSSIAAPDFLGLFSQAQEQFKDTSSGPGDQSASVGANGGPESREAEALRAAQKENAAKLDQKMNGDVNPENKDPAKSDAGAAPGLDAPVAQGEDSLAESLDRAASGGSPASSDPDAAAASNDIDSLNLKKGGAEAAKGSCGTAHQFVIMIDAGSSGSRVHVYEFDVCSQPPVLVHETFHMLKPGLSSFDTDTNGAAHSLDPLLEIAVRVVPDDVKACTPIAVKATAGLRLLGDQKSDLILDAVKTHLTGSYPFAVVQGNGIEIMGGDDEGVYAWVTANYLLGNIGSGNKVGTSAIFDLGGGSTQIVFEPSFELDEEMAPGEHQYDLTFDDNTYSLYQFSHLGFGLNQARNAINSLLVEEAIQNSKIVRGDTLSPHKLISPCLPQGTVVENVKVQMPSGFEYTIEFSGPSKPSSLQCRWLADQILKKDGDCAQPPCSIDGAHQPSLVHAFKSTNDIYAFSYFFDRTQKLGLPSTFTLKQLKDLSKSVCKGPNEWQKAFANEQIVEELRSDSLYCQDLTYMVALLQTGYNIPLHRELKAVERIANNEIGWCLGAALPLIKSDSWSCRN